MRAEVAERYGAGVAVRRTLRQYLSLRQASYHPGKYFPESCRVQLLDMERALAGLRPFDREVLLSEAAGVRMALRSKAQKGRIYRRVLPLVPEALC